MSSRIRKLAILLCLSALSASSQALGKVFSESKSLCITPSAISCGDLMTIRLDAGNFYVDIDALDADEDAFSLDYSVELDNSSSCGIVIGSTMLRHGDTLKAQTLDFGTIELEPGETRRSQRRTFRFSREAAEDFDHVVFSINGQTTACE